jgi:sulfonate transport system permease protein
MARELAVSVAARCGRSVRAMALPALAMVAWWAATRNGRVNTLVLVPLGRLFQTALDPAIARSLGNGLVATFTRLVEGGLLGASLGLLLGTAMGLSRRFDRFIGPSFHGMRQVALFAWIPLFTAWFGNGELCKIVFVALAASKPVVMGAYDGVRTVPLQHLEVGRVLCFSRRRMLRRIVLPWAAPSIVTALQLSLIYSWFAAIGAEYVIGAMVGGIGSVVMGAEEHLRTDVVLLGVFLIAAVGIAMNLLLRRLPRHLFRWKEPG